MKVTDLEKELAKFKTQFTKANIEFDYLANSDENEEVLNDEFNIVLNASKVLGYGKNEVIKTDDLNNFIETYLKELLSVAKLYELDNEVKKISKLID